MSRCDNSIVNQYFLISFLEHFFSDSFRLSSIVSVIQYQWLLFQRKIFSLKWFTFLLPSLSLTDRYLWVPNLSDYDNLYFLNCFVLLVFLSWHRFCHTVYLAEHLMCWTHCVGSFSIYYRPNVCVVWHCSAWHQNTNCNLIIFFKQASMWFAVVLLLCLAHCLLQRI